MRPSRITLALALAANACTTTPPASRFTADDEHAIRALDSVFVAAWLREEARRVLPP